VLGPRHCDIRYQTRTLAAPGADATGASAAALEGVRPLVQCFDVAHASRLVENSGQRVVEAEHDEPGENSRATKL
jgi:hypothetical protein